MQIMKRKQLMSEKCRIRKYPRDYLLGRQVIERPLTY